MPPVEYTDPVLVPSIGGGGSVAVVIEVADAAARLALSLAAATGNTIKQLDDETTWGLKAAGDPSNAADWVAIGAATTSVDWTTGISGKPATFPATAHTHDDRYFTETEVTIALSGKANTAHNHANADLTELADALAEKADADHTHPNADLTELAAALATKAPVGHTHAQADVTGLPAALAAIIPPPLQLDEAPEDASATTSLLIGGTLAPNIAGTVLQEVTPGSQWTSDGNATPPGSGQWIELVSNAIPSSTWRIKVYQNGAATGQTWTSYGGGGAGPAETAWGYATAGGVTGVPIVTFAYAGGTAGVRGQYATWPGGAAICESSDPVAWFKIMNADTEFMAP